MDNRLFNPYVRFFRRRTHPMPYPTPVLSYDFRLFCVHTGKIEVKLSESTVTLSAGDLIVIPPATPYRLLFNEQKVEYDVINFDFVHTAGEYPPTPPVKRSLFHEANIISAECPQCYASPFVARNVTCRNELFNELEAAAGYHHESADSIRSALLKYLLSRIMLTGEHHREKSELVEQIKAYIEENLSGELTNRTVAKAMGYHPNYLNAKFCAAAGLTLHAYIENERMKKAKRLLSLTSMPISLIAGACGFADPSYFVKFFTRHQKMSPKEYRRLSM